MITMLLLFVLIILFSYVYYRYFYVFNKNLKCFPCPPEVPILGHALDFLSGREILDVLMNYTVTYGDVVRLKTGPKRQLLLISDYDFFEFILSTKKFLKKSMDYKYFSRWLGNGLVTAEGRTWQKHRRLITPAFSNRIFENFTHVFHESTSILTEKLDNYVDSTSVDIYPLMNLCTLDIICECAMGTSVGAQLNENSEYVNSVKSMLRIIIERSFSPHKMFDFIYFFTEDYKKEKKALDIIHTYTWNVLKQHQQDRQMNKNEGLNTDKKKNAFLDLLLDANDNDEYLTLEEIREEVDTFMFAGHDTTALGISFTLFCLANYPEEQRKVFMEQKEIFGDDFGRPSSLEDLGNMKYLELVIKESLRLYPPGAVFSRELDEDVLYKGIILPKGLTLSLFIYGLHRNPKYFFEPEKFSPNRFETVDGKNPLGYLPFGMGPRNCIGQKFAMVEMKSIISRIVRTFELFPSVPVHELKLALKTLLTSTNGICLRFQRRKSL